MAKVVSDRRPAPSSAEESVRLIAEFAKDWPMGEYLGPKDSDGLPVVEEWKQNG